MRFLALCFCILLLGSFSQASERLDAPILAATKDATVYITTANGSGTGFLFKVAGKEGWIATNAHVVADAITAGGPITAVFGSGTAKERPLPARLVGLDAQRDLAILRIEGDRLPKPLALAGKAKVEETMPVWVFGFPFGEALAVGDAKPAPTITPTQISSIRSDKFGNVEVLQTGGGINPGNSGGPIINGRGGVIGIVVAKVRGAEIGFGIPTATLEDDLAGRITHADPVVASPVDDTVEVTITVSCIDPWSNITKISALVTPATRVNGALKTDDKGRISGPITTGMTELVLTYKDQEAKGSVKVRLGKDAGTEMVVQFKYQRKDGTSFYTNDLRCRPQTATVATARRPNDPPAERKPVVSFTYVPPKVTVITPPAGSLMAGTSERDGNGNQYTALTSTGKPVDLGNAVMGVACHPSGKEIYVIRKGEPVVAVFDPLTWTSIAEIAVPESPTSIWADSELIGIACGKSKLVALIDSQKRALVTSGKLAERGNYTPDTVIGRAPDGSIMSLWQLDGGAWWDRSLVHTTTDGKSRIMIDGEALYWATWLTDGTGVIGQSNFGHSPSATFDLVFPQGPKGFAELHQSRLFAGQASFHTDSGAAFLTADRKGVVWRRLRIGNNGYDCQRGIPWTYLLNQKLDDIICEFPGSAILELPERQMFVSLGNCPNADVGHEFWKPTCYYVSNKNGRILRRITLIPPKGVEDRLSPFYLPESCAVFIPGHEILLMPNSYLHGGANATTTSYTVYRCGPTDDPVKAPAEAKDTSKPAVEVKPPSIVKVDEQVKYTPPTTTDPEIKDYRLKRSVPGMTVDPKSGVWSWRPGKEFIGSWTITILATVEGKEITAATWTLVVQ